MTGSPTTPEEQPAPSPLPESMPSKPSSAAASPFAVPWFVHQLGGLVDRHPKFWLWLARRETGWLGERLSSISVRMPIYVCGLARSGSTILHEIISAAPGVASHRQKDYPLLFMPYWWRRATANVRPRAPQERPHRDGIMVTAESPDALEEMLWMAFFPDSHDPNVSNLIAATTDHPDFAAFYDAHLRKLLLAENANRYAAKNNYHVARLPYLLQLYPDAKFILPIRAPATHVESLLRQQRWFSQGQREFPHSLAFMQRSGHFEFGLDRRPMNFGDGERIKHIIDDWEAGNEARGLARYWSMVYDYLARLLAADENVRRATQVVRYETLCASPAETIRALFEHCQLPDSDNLVARRAGTIRYPTYYQSALSTDELQVIREETSETASLWGYDENGAVTPN